jgi:Bacterial archaeo-eukaryotic release factor family 3
MQHSLTPQALAELKTLVAPPCLSLYQPTHRSHPDNQQDLLRFRQGVEALTTSLRQLHSAEDTQALIEPFEALAADADFWNHTLDGLAVLGGAGLFRVFVLPRTVAELAVVADSFHTKPLRRFLQSAGRYQVLGLSRTGIRLFEGDRDAIAEIALAPGVPGTIDDALGEELTEPHHTVSSHGGIGSAKSPMHHGQGGKKDEVDKDTERFFRAVDRAVDEHCSKPSGLPLILAALPEHHHLFRKVSHNPLLLETGIDVSPDALKPERLLERAWLAVEPQYQAEQARWTGEFGAASARGLGSDDLADVARAAAEGRVGTLLIEAERQIGGRLDGVSGSIIAADLENPRIDDLLDDLGELVEQMGGQVHVLPADRMPSSSGLAATYRH